ncbi:MAG: hypothetical protein ABW221_05770 [Vicinamibacteria bacterium]
MRTGILLAALGLFAGGAARADDPWEPGSDDGPNGWNMLRHGVVQRGHDLQGTPAAPDRDWMKIVTKARHSYEARVSGMYWDDGCSIAACPRFDRVDTAGAVLTAGSASSEDVDLGTATIGRTVRWIAEAGAAERLLATGDLVAPLGPDSVYDVVYYDTTLFVPRWNNTATQTTVLLLQNTTDTAVTGSAYFHDAAGALLATVPVQVPPQGVQVTATGSIPALAGRSGSAQVAQLGGYGALAGKAVALEPATGFTFDTLVTPVPR